MRRAPFFVVLLAIASTTSQLRADDLEATRRAKSVLTVGSRHITVGELEDKIAAVPLYQLPDFGSGREGIARGFLEKALERDLIFAEGAEVRGLDKQPPTKQLLERVLSGYALRSVRTTLPSADAIPAEDVKKYFDENHGKFDAPERVNVWRILCKSHDEAVSVIDLARKDPTIAKYNDLAREHSIDKATNLRGGNLGFLAPDGVSNEAGVKVDPAVVKAAQSVKDGELVKDPVPEGSSFAVVWRRATVPPTHRSLEDATPQIRSALFRERTERAEKELIADLKKKNVSEVHEDLLGQIELRPFDAGITPSRTIPVAPTGAKLNTKPH